MKVEKKRLTLELDAPIQRRLKAAAELKGMSMSQYCRNAIDKELTKDEERNPRSKAYSGNLAARLKAQQKELFGDTILPGDSVDFIREARQSRTIS